jgi:hypothetical protein
MVDRPSTLSYGQHMLLKRIFMVVETYPFPRKGDAP